MTYKVVSPLVVHPNHAGILQYSYEGKVIGWLDESTRDRLLADGMIVAHEVEAEPVPGVSERPLQTAPKSAWIDYVVSQGIPADEAETFTKAELIALADK